MTDNTPTPTAQPKTRIECLDVETYLFKTWSKMEVTSWRNLGHTAGNIQPEARKYTPSKSSIKRIQKLNRSIKIETRIELLDHTGMRVSFYRAK
jgi:hypothetical protein